jgi:hypothetical protein
MNCCGLSSTGLNDINANNITSDNITIYSNLNFSGFSNLNELLVDNNVSFISSLNVSGFTTLNKTTRLSSLNVSGFVCLLPVCGSTTPARCVFGPQLQLSACHLMDVTPFWIEQSIDINVDTRWWFLCVCARVYLS